MNTHLDNVQGDLEALKEFLRNGGGDDYQVDANTLLNVSNFKKILCFLSLRSLKYMHRHTNTHYTCTHTTQLKENTMKKNSTFIMLHIDLFYPKVRIKSVFVLVGKKNYPKMSEKKIREDKIEL